MNPVVTVGVPFHDEERTIAAAVRSVLSQSLVDVEVLLVDDGSTDRSLDIARSFRDPRVVVVSDGVRRGLPARLNEIAWRARGDVIARMDADDVCHSTRLARQVALLTGDPRLDFVGAWAGLVDDAGAPFAVVEAGVEEATRASVLERGLISHASMVARTAWLRANAYDESLTRAEDRDLFCRVAGSARAAVVEAPLYVVRVVPRGRAFVRDYLESGRQTRTLLFRHGASSLGPRRLARLWLASHLKGLATAVAVGAGFGEALVRRRGRPPTPAERALIQEALATAGIGS